LDESLTEAQKELLIRLTGGRREAAPDEAYEKLRRKLTGELDELVISKAAVCVLLHRSKKTDSGKFPRDTALWLLEKRGLRHHALRWLTLSGEDVPPEVLTKIARIAADEQLGYGIRIGAVRAYAAGESDGKLFETLATQLRKNPSIPGNSLREYFYNTITLSKLLHDLRPLPDSRRAAFLVGKEFGGAGIWSSRYDRFTATAFYPREFFEGVLSRLENHQGELTPSDYQAPLHDAAKQLAERGALSKEMADRLKEDLLTLPRRKLLPIADAMGATSDWERFGLTMIQCYKKLDKSEGYDPEKGGIAANLTRMKLGSKDIIEVLRDSKRKAPYRKYAGTIDDIIRHIERIRKRFQEE
jgi:hypothetical protein